MLHIPDSDKKRVVIIGGGFGGLKLASSLGSSGYQVVLIDKNNYHQFQPLFYQVATAGIEPSAILFPLRKVLHRLPDCFLRISEVEKVDTASRIVYTTTGFCKYDFLIVATGAGSNYFGLKNVEAACYPMKSVTEALALRNALLQNLEKALVCETEEERDALMNIVIVGGGPTGTEVAGALAEMKKLIFPKEYKELDISKVRILLVEASKGLLGGMSGKSSLDSLRYLRSLGVEIYLETQVRDYVDGCVVLSNGDTVRTNNLIWAAGISGNVPFGFSKEQITGGNRLIVDAYHRVKDTQNVFAIGDVCAMVTDDLPRGHPQVAQVAIQQAANLSRNFHAMSKNKTLRPFKYKNLGSMATVGRHLAVADLPGIRLYGWFAWYVWMFVHLMSILGVKNRLFVFLNWLWSYVTFDQSLRLIIQRENK